MCTCNDKTHTTATGPRRMPSGEMTPTAGGMPTGSMRAGPAARAAADGEMPAGSMISSSAAPSAGGMPTGSMRRSPNGFRPS
jgi:hypothetical protein